MARSYSLEEIQTLANGLVGKTFGEINNYEVSSTDYNKGSFGHIIESDGYEYNINSFSEPDFLEAGVELKVTPYKINKNRTLSAKERLVLNIINYMDEYKNEFFNSHFWYKNKRIQILWYLFEEGKAKNDLKITHQLLYEFPKDDLKIIEKDWETIIQKIKDGKAHEISEADTMYLGACTKGANSNSLREQPFSPIKAMQRAFCLKTSYMTQLVRSYIGDASSVEKILDNKTTLPEFINNIVNKYKGKTQKELMREFNIDSKAKNINAMLISRMFGVKRKLSETDEFLKAKIIPKTIRIEENSRIKESISFPYFKYTEIVNQNWEDCDLKEELETTKYMFFVFKKENGEYVFKGIKLWNMPEIDIETSVMEMWKKTYNTIKTGNIVKSIENGIRKTNFVGMSENKVCHVRPHGRDAKDTCKLPISDKLTGATEYTKHCFWINNTYIREIFKEFI